MKTFAEVIKTRDCKQSSFMFYLKYKNKYSNKATVFRIYNIHIEYCLVILYTKPCISCSFNVLIYNIHIEYCIVVMHTKPTFVAFHVHFIILICIMNTVLQFCTKYLAIYSTTHCISCSFERVHSDYSSFIDS